MAKKTESKMTGRPSTLIDSYGWDLLLAIIAAIYVFAVPYTKVEESFNVQAMHDVLYNRHQLEKYDHFEFPGVVPRTFLGALVVSLLASPFVVPMQLLHLPKLYSLIAVRLVLGCIVLATLRFFRIQVRRMFGYRVEAFFSILTILQFHVMFYSTRPLPNIMAFSLVNMAYAFWLNGSFYATLRCLVFGTIVFRCDTLLLLGPIGLELLMTKSVSLWEAIRCCIQTALLSIGITILIDSIMWQKLLWPELQVFWFNSVLNRSSEWGTYPFHWYFTSALPRSLLGAYPLAVLGALLDRRIQKYILPVFTFILLYSKLPHKELRFIISSIPMFNLSAAVAAGRIFNNRHKKAWLVLNAIMFGSFLVSLGCSVLTFLASYNNYPGGYALQILHQTDQHHVHTENRWVHIDPFVAMNGVSRFCESDSWRYSKEEGINLTDYQQRNFTYLLNEHPAVEGFRCLFAANGFSRVLYQFGFPPLLLVNVPKVFILGNSKHPQLLSEDWPGCP